jgi:hypothetical protein
VAGVFFKQWAYTRRGDAAPSADGEGTLPKRLASPLVIAAAPEWLRSTPRGADARGVWIGLAFVAAMSAAWLAMARISRRDKLARDRRARYDGPSELFTE